MKNILKILLIVATVSVASCSTENTIGGGVIASNTALNGKVFGKNFTFKGGKSFPSGDKISIYLTDVVADCSSDIFKYEYRISTVIEKKIGTNTKANVVFGKEGEIPLNVLQSTVTIESVTDTEIKGKIKSESNEDNTVEGSFTVPYCK